MSHTAASAPDAPATQQTPSKAAVVVPKAAPPTSSSFNLDNIQGDIMYVVRIHTHGVVRSDDL